MGNPYKDYYDACRSSDEFSELRKREARERIERQEYANSWSGEGIETSEADSYQGGS